jgi:hypothetical protein
MIAALSPYRGEAKCVKTVIGNREWRTSVEESRSIKTGCDFVNAVVNIPNQCISHALSNENNLRNNKLTAVL